MGRNDDGWHLDEGELLAPGLNALRRLRGLRDGQDGDRPHVVLEHIVGPRLSSLVRRASWCATGVAAA